MTRKIQARPLFAWALIWGSVAAEGLIVLMGMR